MDLLYDWKLHYADPLRSLGVQDGFAVYRIENESGSGFVRSCTVFPGIQLVLNDLQMQYCARSVPPSAQVLELHYCLEGRYQCEVNDRYCFYVSAGDFCAGTVGRSESRGGFPTGRFRSRRSQPWWAMPTPGNSRRRSVTASV